MNNKTFITLTGISGLLFLVGQISLLTFNNIKYAGLIAQVGILLFQLFAIILLIKNGTLIKTNYFKIIIGFGIIAVLAFFFASFLWNASFIIISISVTGVIWFYILHFIKKNTRTRLDYFKLTWVLSFISVNYFAIIFDFSKEISFIPVIILLVAFIEFLVKNKNEA